MLRSEKFDWTNVLELFLFVQNIGQINLTRFFAILFIKSCYLLSVINSLLIAHRRSQITHFLLFFSPLLFLLDYSRPTVFFKIWFFITDCDRTLLFLLSLALFSFFILFLMFFDLQKYMFYALLFKFT